MAPSKEGTSASADCDGRAAEINPPKIPKLAIMLMPARSFRRETKPITSASQEMVSSMPIFSTVLLFVPKVCIAKLFNHFGV